MELVDKIKIMESGVPATVESIELAEKELGFPLPQTIKDIYLKIANGGIGSGYKILGVKGGHTSDEGDTTSELYVTLGGSDPEDPKWKQPTGLVPFYHWGCAINSCIDTTKENFPVVQFDPSLGEIGKPMEQLFILHKNSLTEWLEEWLNGDDL